MGRRTPAGHVGVWAVHRLRVDPPAVRFGDRATDGFEPRPPTYAPKRGHPGGPGSELTADELRDAVENPSVYVLLSVAVRAAIRAAVELPSFDGDPLTAVIAGGAGGLAFGR